ICEIASANVKRWKGSGNAQAEILATGSAKIKAWQGSANAYAETLARASAQWKHWNGSANASVLATAVASAKFKKWRSTGTAKAEPIIPPIDPVEPPIMDADVFTRIRGRAANVIAKYGDTVWFYGEGTPASENSDGTWTEATDETRFDAKGIQTRGDPDELGL